MSEKNRPPKKWRSFLDPGSLASHIEEELGELAGISQKRIMGARPPDGPLRLAFELARDKDGTWTFRGESLLSLLEEALEEASARSDSLQSGHVYCYRCETALCDHGRPSHPTEVFRGYNSTGLPQWSSFSQALLDIGHPDVDRIYGPSHAILAQFQTGRELKAQQLRAFGRSSKSYDVLGQVIAGYFRIPGNPPEYMENESFAFTFQTVESRALNGEARLALNLVVFTPEGNVNPDSILEYFDDSIKRAILKARWDLTDLEESLRHEGFPTDPKKRSEILGRVPGILKKLARSIEHKERRKKRRTLHAEERREQERPVQAATEEAVRSGLEKTFVDEKSEAIIVLGRKNRVHVFSADGRHVTSLFMLPESVDRRIRLKRWRPVSPDEYHLFHKNLNRSDDRRDE